MRTTLPHDFHTSALGGHSGNNATYHCLKHLFYWPGMKKQTENFIAACRTCQLTKPEHVKQPGLLKPLELLDMAWSHISLDFIEGLPNS